MVALTAVVLAGCGAGTAEQPGSEAPAAEPQRPVGMPAEVPPATGVVQARRPNTVLAHDDGEPRLCVNGTTDAARVRCAGESVALEGFAWSVEPEEIDGVRQDLYLLAGRFDGTVLTVTDAQRWDPEQDPGNSGSFGDLGDAGNSGEEDLRTVCPTPPGGWTVVDPARTTLGIVDRLPFVAEKLPGYNSFWFDDSRNPAPDHAGTPVDVANDPRYLTANLLVSQDVRGATRALRKVWGGALCVRRTRYDLPGLERLSQETGLLPGIIDARGRRDGIDIEAVHDDGSLQRWADRTYGAGVVEVSSYFVPDQD